VLTVLSQSAADVLDEVISLFDQAVSPRESLGAHFTGHAPRCGTSWRPALRPGRGGTLCLEY
jgi:hypothetical protein